MTESNEWVTITSKKIVKANEQQKDIGQAREANRNGNTKQSFPSQRPKSIQPHQQGNQKKKTAINNKKRIKQEQNGMENQKNHEFKKSHIHHSTPSQNGKSKEKKNPKSLKPPQKSQGITLASLVDLDSKLPKHDYASKQNQFSRQFTHVNKNYSHPNQILTGHSPNIDQSQTELTWPSLLVNQSTEFSTKNIGKPDSSWPLLSVNQTQTEFPPILRKVDDSRPSLSFNTAKISNNNTANKLDNNISTSQIKQFSDPNVFIDNDFPTLSMSSKSISNPRPKNMTAYPTKDATTATSSQNQQSLNTEKSLHKKQKAKTSTNGKSALEHPNIIHNKITIQKNAPKSSSSLQSTSTNQIKTENKYPNNPTINHILNRQHHASAQLLTVDENHLSNMLPLGNTVKGKQKLRARKKKLSSLKKRILLERLEQYKQSQKSKQLEQTMDENESKISPSDSHLDVVPQNISPIICIKDYVSLEEIEDDDEYEEIMSNLRDMAEKVGTVLSLHIPKGNSILTSSSTSSSTCCDITGWAFVYFLNLSDAQAALSCWEGLVIGGMVLNICAISHDIFLQLTNNGVLLPWEDGCDFRIHENDLLYSTPYSNSLNMTTPSTTQTNCIAKDVSNIVYIRNYANPEELEDDDEYDEIIQDLSDMAEKIGPIYDIYMSRHDSSDVDQQMIGWAFVLFVDEEDAKRAMMSWVNLVIGGSKLIVGSIPKSILTQPSDEMRDWRHCVINNFSYINTFEHELQVGTQDQPKHEEHISMSNIVYICKYANPDELEDDDEYDELIQDLMNMAGKVGTVDDVYIPRQDHDNVDGSFCETIGWAFVRFVDEDDAKRSLISWSNLIIGGSKFIVGCIPDNLLTQLSDETTDWKQCVIHLSERSILDKRASSASGEQLESVSNMLYIRDYANPDELEDDDEYDEIIQDLTDMAAKVGITEHVYIPRHSHENTDDSSYTLIGWAFVRFVDQENAKQAFQSWNNLVIGGNTLAVGYVPESIWLPFHKEQIAWEEFTIHFSKVMEDRSRNIQTNVPCHQITDEAETMVSSSKLGSDDNKDDLKEPQPMYSCNKRIQPLYAECKRVPKIPNAGKPRKYATLYPEQESIIIIPLLSEMLGELMRLQIRSKDDKNAKARRRLVIGLREVARGIRSHKVKMIVMANNLDEYGVVDDKIQEVIDLATEQDIPIFYELNKRKLGKALGKSIKVAIAGIQNADGAYEPFKKLKKIAQSI